MTKIKKIPKNELVGSAIGGAVGNVVAGPLGMIGGALIGNYFAKKKKTNEELEEKLNPKMGVRVYIDDFIKSNAPQFAGKSKNKRIKMALGAYYATKTKEKLNELSKEKLAIYAKKASTDMVRQAKKRNVHKFYYRNWGKDKAIDKLASK